MKKILLAAVACLMLASCGNKQNAKEDAAQADSTQTVLGMVPAVPYSATTVNKKDGKIVLVVSASPRKGGNTDLLCDEFVKGATEAGGQVEKVNLADFKQEFLSEQGANQPKDVPHSGDSWVLLDKFLKADVVVLASPVYYYNVTDRMKTFIDNTFMALSDERIKGKEYYYITACVDQSEKTAQCCINGLRGMVCCFPNSTERGYVLATGMGAPGAVKGSDFMKQAYELGLGINK